MPEKTLSSTPAKRPTKTRGKKRTILGFTEAAAAALVLAMGYILLFPCSCYVGNLPAVGDERTAGGKLILFTGFDGLIRPRQEVVLKAKLETFYLKRDIKNQTVLCLVDGQTLPPAKTDREGFARWRFIPDRPGLFEVRYQLPDDSDYTPQKTTALLAVRTDDKPILVTDLDNTVIDIDAYQFLFHDNRKIPPLTGAVESLNELARFYDIIYLTARDDVYMNVTRDWLNRYGLPAGPLFVRDLSEDSSDPGRFKKEALARLKKDWPSLAVGVGDKVHDAEAYLACGLQAYIIGSPRNVPDKAVPVRTWQDIRQKLIH